MSENNYVIAQLLENSDNIQSNKQLATYFRNIGDNCSDMSNSANNLASKLAELNNDMKNKISDIEQIDTSDIIKSKHKPIGLWRHILGKHSLK